MNVQHGTNLVDPGSTVGAAARPALEARDAQAERIADLLWQVRHLLRDRLTADVPADELTAWVTRSRILGGVVGEPGITVNELARRILMPRSRVSVLVGELEDEGLVTKLADRSDRRLVRLEPTEDGRRKREEWRSVYRRLLGSYVRRLRPEMREGLIAGLEGLREALAEGSVQ